MQCARPGPGISKKSRVASLTLFKLTRINGVCPFCYMQPVYQVWSCNLTLLPVAYKVWTDTPHHINKLAYVYGNISSIIISYSVLDEKYFLHKGTFLLLNRPTVSVQRRKESLKYSITPNYIYSKVTSVFHEVITKWLFSTYLFQNILIGIYLCTHIKSAS